MPKCNSALQTEKDHDWTQNTQKYLGIPLLIN